MYHIEKRKKLKVKKKIYSPKKIISRLLEPKEAYIQIKKNNYMQYAFNEPYYVIGLLRFLQNQTRRPGCAEPIWLKKKSNPVIFMTISVIFMTNPVIFRTNPVIFSTNTVKLRTTWNQNMDRNRQTQTETDRNGQVHLSFAKFSQFQPDLVKFNQVQPSLAKFSQAQPSSAMFSQVQPSLAKYRQAQPSLANYSQVKPS